MDPTTFEHLNEHELRTARQLIKADKFVIEKCPKVKDNPKTKTPVKAKRTSEINFLAEMCNYSSANNKDSAEPETTNIDQEIAFYEENNQADDFRKYWQNNCEKLPILTAFVKRYCIISATSVPSEAAFSIANYLQRKERSAMSSKMLRISMVMKETYYQEQLDYLKVY